MQIDYDEERGILKISQEKYIKKLLHKFNMLNCHSVKVPIDVCSDLTSEDQSEEEFNLKPLCRSAIGCLLYAAMATRPDLAFVVSYLSRFQDKGGRTLFQSIKKVFRYLSGTSNLCLHYERVKEEKLSLHGYSDADWGNDPIDRRSTCGYLFYVCNSLVSWGSKKQAAIALSSTEAEYYALSLAASEGQFLLKILNDFNSEVSRFTIFEDNLSTIKIAQSPDQRRLKHIDIRYHYIKDLVKNQVVNLEYVSTADQFADLLTKPLNSTKFSRLRRNLCLKEAVESQT